MSNYSELKDVCSLIDKWEEVELPIKLHLLISHKVVMWCMENTSSRWSMLAVNKFVFEDPCDALAFRLRFSFSK